MEWPFGLDGIRTIKKHLIDKSDFKNIEIVQSVDEAIELLKPYINNFYTED